MNLEAIYGDFTADLQVGEENLSDSDLEIQFFIME